MRAASLFVAAWLVAALPSLAQITSCPIHSFQCGTSASGTLSPTDCDIGPGFVTDLYPFDGMAGQTVTIDGTSSQLDPILFLFRPPDPDQPPVAQDDDSGPGNDPRIVFDLDVSGTWTIALANSLANQLGSYTLSLDCDGGTGGTPPAPPSRLRATALSDSEIRLNWRDNSDNEDEFRIQVRTGGTPFQDIGSVPPDLSSKIIEDLLPQTT